MKQEQNRPARRSNMMGWRQRLFRLLVIVGSIAATITAIEISYRIYLSVSGTWVTFTSDGLKVLPKGHGTLRGGTIIIDQCDAK